MATEPHTTDARAGRDPLRRRRHPYPGQSSRRRRHGRRPRAPGRDQGRAARGPGSFETPAWDPVSQKKVRDALIVLASTLTDTCRSFGMPDEVDPVQRADLGRIDLGGNPRKDAIYLDFTSAQATMARHSIACTSSTCRSTASGRSAVYNAAGHYEENDLGAYSLNMHHVRDERRWLARHPVRRVLTGKSRTCLPTPPGWSYTVRLYRPRAEITARLVDVPCSCACGVRLWSAATPPPDIGVGHAGLTATGGL